MRKFTSLCLAVFLLALTVSSTTAQEEKEQNKLPAVSKSIVTFTLQSLISLDTTDTMQLPSSITDYLDKQDQLATLNVDFEDRERNAWLRVSYVFSNMNDYREWRQSDKTKKFLKTMGKGNGKVSMSLAMQRRPLDDYVKYSKNQN